MLRITYRQAKRQSPESRYTTERSAASIGLDKFSGGNGSAASDSEEERPPASESGAAPLRSRAPCRKSKKGGKRGLSQPRQQRQVDKEESVGNLGRQLAALRLDSPASSDRSSLDARDFVSPSGKASSLESARARADSYHLGADVVLSRHDI